MARKPNRPPVVCEFFAWRLFQRDGVYYADGRTGKYNLGKHSLARTHILERQPFAGLGDEMPVEALIILPFKHRFSPLFRGQSRQKITCRCRHFLRWRMRQSWQGEEGGNQENTQETVG